jgi:DNA modification methylase
MIEHVVHLGDCLDPVTGIASLPDKSVDHVICDPPYEAEAHRKSKRATPGRDGRFGVSDFQIDFEPITETQRLTVAEGVTRASRRWALVFCQVDAVERWRSALESAGASWRRAAIWVKPDSTPQFTGDRPAQACECIAMAWTGGGRSTWNGGGKRGIYEFNCHDWNGGREHPTMKPLALMEALVRDFTDPGDLVLDPFAGSGTTGVACKRLGRRFLGWEKDPKYHAIAVKRIEAAREQYVLPISREPEPRQADLIAKVKP